MSRLNHKSDFSLTLRKRKHVEEGWRVFVPLLRIFSVVYKIIMIPLHYYISNVRRENSIYIDEAEHPDLC